MTNFSILFGSTSNVELITTYLVVGSVTSEGTHYHATPCVA